MELKIDFSNRKAIAGAIVLICAIAFIFYLPTILAETSPQQCVVNGVCQHEQRLSQVYQLVPGFVLIGIVIGALVFFFMTSRLEKKEKSLKNNTEVLLRFLNQDERKLVNALVENNGKVLQAEITRLPEMSKVKSHRIVQRLIDRGVIEKESLGKTNIVRFTKEIKEGLI